MADERSEDGSLQGENGFEKHRRRAEITTVDWMSSLGKPNIRPGVRKHPHFLDFSNLSICETVQTAAEMF